jgi:hypothetical protein
MAYSSEFEITERAYGKEFIKLIEVEKEGKSGIVSKMFH